MLAISKEIKHCKRVKNELVSSSEVGPYCTVMSYEKICTKIHPLCRGNIKRTIYFVSQPNSNTSRRSPQKISIGQMPLISFFRSPRDLRLSSTRRFSAFCGSAFVERELGGTSAVKFFLCLLILFSPWKEILRRSRAPMRPIGMTCGGHVAPARCKSTPAKAKRGFAGDIEDVVTEDFKPEQEGKRRLWRAF